MAIDGSEVRSMFSILLRISQRLMSVGFLTGGKMIARFTFTSAESTTNKDLEAK